MNPKNISINDFLYNLPEEKIAKYPLQKRDDSKLLIYENGSIKESTYNLIVDEIPEQSLVIFNNTKVVEARLLFTKETGSIIEIFCLEPSDDYNDITSAMLQKNKVIWKCLIGGAKKWKEEKLTYPISTTEFVEAHKIEKKNDYFLIEFTWKTDASFAEVLHLIGNVPLPPYLNRAVEEQDKKSYQTIYAKEDGSVAAPTAGLHFTENIFSKFIQKNIRKEYLTLHVGAGTFKPVKADTMEDHEMHQEFFEVSVSLIENVLNNLENNIITVGTTSLRTLETLYWMGVKLINNKNVICVDDIQIHQWDAYELPQNIKVEEALVTLINWMKANHMNKLFSKTQIIIAPGYTPKIANALITNFHQPKSTLLLLVSAFVNEDWRKIYNYALESNFRFLSYGDGSLLWHSKK